METSIGERHGPHDRSPGRPDPEADRREEIDQEKRDRARAASPGRDLEGQPVGRDDAEDLAGARQGRRQRSSAAITRM